MLNQCGPILLIQFCAQQTPNANACECIMLVPMLKCWCILKTPIPPNARDVGKSSMTHFAPSCLQRGVFARGGFMDAFSLWCGLEPEICQCFQAATESRWCFTTLGVVISGMALGYFTEKKWCDLLAGSSSLAGLWGEKTETAENHQMNRMGNNHISIYFEFRYTAHIYNNIIYIYIYNAKFVLITTPRMFLVSRIKRPVFFEKVKNIFSAKIWFGQPN